MGFDLRPRFLIHILVICLTSSSVINVAQGQSTADEYLIPHNDARAGLNQGIPSLTWDTTLESYASDWAATRAAAGDDCALIHSGGPYGENIYWSSGPSTPADAVQLWVSEEAYYDYATNSCSAPEGESCGHYTQVVWRDTAALGCGSATCLSGALFVVCSYDPPGNVVGQLPY
ncbi:pathogenesis-related protein 1 [Marchantia polymorpha subsp. ruderalis]|uniref:SCP domain-containing protein n=1 Tax=Marchantia polymorpha TaxID=3197 RepID=A0A2R6XDD2_MARPO|nr:hypothetical protein MARPO_0021s0004 [Marchantia polymorpha]BBN01199.1 hypothetical protein Mp_2g05480 [Marchantia polymorpha subsp. ruderalis]|eukprot:PTQ44121.1 hypothetical protein MARPO_0021s0004 [Marchantia polymorpha]